VRVRKFRQLGGPAVDWQTRYTDYFYKRRSGWQDGTSEFWSLCRQHIAPGSQILEVGPGPENPTSRFLASLGELHGVDVDPDARHNPHLATLGLIEDGAFPPSDASFDACVSNYVLEHVQDPVSHLREVHRILRPGGKYVFRAPNKWHYIPLVARATPHWFHAMVANELRQLPTDAHEPYPTYFRLNSRSDIAACAAVAGLDVDEMRLIEKNPSYGHSSRLLFLLFMAYERVVNASEALAPLRVSPRR